MEDEDRQRNSMDGPAHPKGFMLINLEVFVLKATEKDHQCRTSF